MTSWKSMPHAKVVVTHSAVDYTLDWLSIVNLRYENGFDTATVLLEDTQARNYGDKADAGDVVKISQKDRSDAAWTEILDGTVKRIVPIVSVDGNYLRLECDGAGAGLAAMLCGEEYGSESSNPTLDTIKEMVEDNTNGIVDLWVNKLNGTGTTTGYSYTTALETIAGTIKYLYFPYKPATKCLKDICDVVQGIKGAAAGPHWIVDTSHRLLITTVGAHSAAGDNPAQYWPTWWRTDQAGSTLVEGVDFTNFQSYKLAKEANYVLYHGKFRRPGNGDFFTENQHALWGSTAATLSSDNVNYRVGSYSLKGTSAVSGGEMVMYYPSSGTWNLDVTKLGGEHNIPTVNFHARRNSEITTYTLTIWFNGGVSTAYRHLTLTTDKWAGFSFPIGPYCYTVESGDPWTYSGATNWADVDSIRFVGARAANANDKYIWVDGFNIAGYLLRGARQAAAFTSAAPCKMKHIEDDVGKDDILSASDDSGTIGRLAYAEYLRASTTPTTCTFTVPVANDLLPGQLVHLHAKKKADASFRIDADFRITRLEHNFTSKGFVTHVDATSDVLNSDPRPLPMRINSYLKAVKPEFQDRQASSIKARELDITQPILEKSY